VFFAMPAADMLAALVSAVFMFFELKRLREKKRGESGGAGATDG
jgi:hypothetical protein